MKKLIASKVQRRAALFVARETHLQASSNPKLKQISILLETSL